MDRSGQPATEDERRLGRSGLGDDLSFLLARANALSVSAGNAALAPHGLKVRSYSVLALAASGQRPTQRELAEFLRLDPSQIVALVDELQARGLVERVPDPADRRAKVVVATVAGEELFAHAHRAAASAENDVHAPLDASDRTQLRTILQRLAFPG